MIFVPGSTKAPPHFCFCSTKTMLPFSHCEHGNFLCSSIYKSKTRAIILDNPKHTFSGFCRIVHLCSLPKAICMLICNCSRFVRSIKTKSNRQSMNNLPGNDRNCNHHCHLPLHFDMVLPYTLYSHMHYCQICRSLFSGVHLQAYASVDSNKNT